MEKHGIARDKQVRKLTMILNTHDQYIDISSYYLWYLLDNHHFIIVDIKCIVIFSAHTDFIKFVTTFFNKRIETISKKG
jgi:hypothetical protein